MTNFRLRWAPLRAAACTLALSVGGCYSGLDGSSSGAGDGAGDGTGGDDSGDSAGDDGIVESELPAPTTRVFRLTHEQWENTVRDLFYLAEPTGFSDQFRTDPASSGYIFENNVLSLEVDQALWSGYQRAAADVAELVTADPQLLDTVLPPDPGDDAARARTFIEEFGMRAYRRPLTDAEVDTYVQQFSAAPDLYEGLDPFTAGARLIIETILQSPHFLYRVEASTEPDGEVIPLSDFEVASRMSYFLWNTMPDAELFDLASAQMLSDSTVREQALRMLDDPRAEGVIRSFHAQLLETEDFESVAPSDAFYPDAPDDLGALAVAENELFVNEIVQNQQGGLTDLLTSTETFVNDELAAIYGVEGTFGPDFVKASLDPERRRGIFTQVGFLAANATSVNPDPIHRGVFLVERITCTHLPAPPDNVPPLPELEPNQTNRQLVEQHTEAEGSVCAGCHATLINPYGFPFENYDSVGAFRTQDNGFDIDASSNVPLDGAAIPVNNAVDLIDALAQSPSVHDCYVKHWVEFAHGRNEAPEDEPFVTRLGESSRVDGASVRDLVVSLVTSQPFLTRSTEELQ